MNKKISLRIGIVLLIVAICFLLFALNHPEASFPWSNKVTFMIYGAYIWLMLKFLIFMPFCNPQKGSLLSIIIYLFLSIGALVTEMNMVEANIYTIIRGFVVLGGIDIAIENLYRYIKSKK